MTAAPKPAIMTPEAMQSAIDKLTAAVQALTESQSARRKAAELAAKTGKKEDAPAAPPTAAERVRQPEDADVPPDLDEDDEEDPEAAKDPFRRFTRQVAKYAKAALAATGKPGAKFSETIERFSESLAKDTGVPKATAFYRLAEAMYSPAPPAYPSIPAQVQARAAQLQAEGLPGPQSLYRATNESAAGLAALSSAQQHPATVEKFYELPADQNVGDGLNFDPTMATPEIKAETRRLHELGLPIHAAYKRAVDDARLWDRFFSGMR